jgi:hypothetical protein
VVLRKNCLSSPCRRCWLEGSPADGAQVRTSFYRRFSPLPRSNPNHSTSEPETFTTTVSLLPGTHHIKFIVDENWKLAQDLPTAVDDDGSLANYVSVPLPAGPSAPASPPPTSSGRPAHQISFWSQTSDPGVCTPFGDEGWTSVIPPGLISAAREEEVFLANGAVGTAPNIPPAPVLPRHLDKLILNTRIGATPPAPAKERRHRARTRHGELGMTKQDEQPPAVPPRIPVTTASGTDVSAAARHGHSNSQPNTPVRTLVGGSTAALKHDCCCADVGRRCERAPCTIACRAAPSQHKRDPQWRACSWQHDPV